MTGETTRRVALLGCDRDVLRLVSALARQTRLRVVAGHCADRHEDALRALVPGITLHDHWEPLLADTEIDVTLVACDQREPWREDALRRLVRAGRVLWLVHPACSYLLAIELDVTRRAHGSTLVPYCPALSAPALRHFKDLVAERRASDEQPCSVELELTTPVFSRDLRAAAALRARDVSLLQHVAGPLTRVLSAEHVVAGGVSAWSVTLETERHWRVRWSAADAQQQSYTGLQARWGQQSARLRVAQDTEWWSLTTTLERDAQPPPAARWDPCAQGIADLCASLDPSEECAGAPIPWSQVCDDLEVLDAVEHSRDGRRVVVLRERLERPEREFQGRMAMGGCLLLVLCLTLLVGGTLREVFWLPRGAGDAASRTIDPDSHAVQMHRAERDTTHPLWLRLWPVYPLVLYLLYQLGHCSAGRFRV